ncbi:MAG TPA: hypothetical protein VF476_10350 [Chitinophagaceae bacterium]
MKTLLFILFPIFILSNSATAQRINRRISDQEIKNRQDQIRREDSLDGLLIDDQLLKAITDTIPIESTDESSGWRDMKTVTYYIDSLNILRRISFRDGRAGSYYFYFDGTHLKKVRVSKPSSTYQTYYYTAEENSYTVLQIEQMETQYVNRKEFYYMLKLARGFKEKLKTLL